MTIQCPACGTHNSVECDCDRPCQCDIVCFDCQAKFNEIDGHNDNDYCDNCGKYTFLPVNSSYDRACSNCGHTED